MAGFLTTLLIDKTVFKILIFICDASATNTCFIAVFENNKCLKSLKLIEISSC